MSDSQTFGQALRRLREQASLSQEQLAHKAAISARQVSRLETGVQAATWPVVLSLATALGISCEAFTQEPTAQSAPKKGRPRKK